MNCDDEVLAVIRELARQVDTLADEWHAASGALERIAAALESQSGIGPTIPMTDYGPVTATDIAEVSRGDR